VLTIYDQDPPPPEPPQPPAPPPPEPPQPPQPPTPLPPFHVHVKKTVNVGGTKNHGKHLKGGVHTGGHIPPKDNLPHEPGVNWDQWLHGFHNLFDSVGRDPVARDFFQDPASSGGPYQAKMDFTVFRDGTVKVDRWSVNPNNPGGAKWLSALL